MAKRMYRDFPQCRAWTDAMCEGGRYIGLIQFQALRAGAEVEMLWVVAPGCQCRRDAEWAAWRMLQRVSDISADGQVWFDDGVAL